MSAGLIIVIYLLTITVQGQSVPDLPVGNGEGCLSEIYSIIPGHTGCLQKSPHVDEPIMLSDSLKQTIVRYHNDYRATLEAANMQKMVWDEELAALAQKWTDNCDVKHDSRLRDIPGKYTTGQNLGAGHYVWSQLLSHWFSEQRFFDYDDKEGTDFSKVGHYTQLVWAESARIGCSLTRCNNLRGNGLFYACNYATQGNMRWWIPYNDTNSYGVRGVCASCPETCNEDGLCDCGGKVCENGGTLDVNTCRCSCLKKFHTNESCSVDCERANDSRHCGGFWKEEDCLRYRNVPNECPLMCGICPVADYRLRMSTTPTSLGEDNSSTVSLTTDSYNGMVDKDSGSKEDNSKSPDKENNYDTSAKELDTREEKSNTDSSSAHSSAPPSIQAHSQAIILLIALLIYI